MVHECVTKSNSQNGYFIKHKSRFWIFWVTPDLAVFLVKALLKKIVDCLLVGAKLILLCDTSYKYCKKQYIII